MAEGKGPTQKLNDFKSEWERVGSFSTFPDFQNGSTIKLSASGFYYTGVGTVCRCYSCGTEHDDWSAGQVPSHGPGCKWRTDNHPVHKFRSQCVDQVSENSLTGALNRPDTLSQAFQWLRINSKDTHGTPESPKRDFPPAENGSTSSKISQFLRICEERPHRRHIEHIISNQHSRDIVESNVREPSVRDQPISSFRVDDKTNEDTYVSKAKEKEAYVTLTLAHVDYPRTPLDQNVNERRSDYDREERVPTASCEVKSPIEKLSNSIRKEDCPRTRSLRLDSFRDWPPGSTQSTEELARAGFSYTGPGETVTCPFCHLTRSAWEPSDIPWRIHSQNSPSCRFVLHQTPYSQVSNQYVHLDSFKEVVDFSFDISHTVRAFNVLSSTLDIRDIKATDVLGYFLKDECDKSQKECCQENTCVCCKRRFGDVSPSLLLLPCRHGVCYCCRERVDGLEDCPSCEEIIKATHQVFLS